MAMYVRTSPLLGEFCFLDNSSYSFCGKVFVATYPTRNTNGSLCVISVFRREEHKICAVLGYTQRIVLISYRRFRTTYRSHLQGPIN